MCNDVDQPIIRDLAEMLCGRNIPSQRKVGGWPLLK
jgi:hypothetical protein